MKRAMKTAVLIAGVASVLAVFFSAPGFAQQKYAYVRPNYVLDNYAPYSKAMDKVEAYENAEATKLKQRVENFQKSVEGAQKQAQLMNEEQIAKKRKELETEQANIQNEQDGLRDKFLNNRQKLVQPIYDQFNAVMTQVGEREGYDFILNADMESQAVLYANPKLDISDAVLAELNKLAAAESSAAPAKSAPAVPATK